MDFEDKMYAAIVYMKRMDAYFSLVVGVRKDGSKEFRVSQGALE